MRRTTLFFGLLCAVLFRLPALDVRDGLVRVFVDETTGRPILYRLSAVKGQQYEALTFETDARTSFISLSLDQRKIKLGETQEFKVGVRRLPAGAAVEYLSPVFSLVQKIEFVKSTDSQVFNGFKISYEVKNLGPKDSKLALRQIWDTRLGEKSGIHFATAGSQRIDTELLIQADSTEPFLLSPGESSSLALLLAPAPRPDLVVAANWKRLSDALWLYDTPMRGFSMPPYSINDSALGLYWNEVILKAGASKTFVSYFLCGGEGLEFVKYLKTGPSIAGEVVQPPKSSARKDKLLLDIEELKKLLASLDAAIATVDSVKDEEVQALLARLSELQAATGTK